MATNRDPPESELLPTNSAGRLLEGRPLVGLVMVLLVTGGHTMNLRETGESQGWVAAEVYTLQSFYLVSLALAMLACPALARRWSCRTLALAGLVMGTAGGLLNGIEVWLSLSAFLIGRVLAGIGAGLVIYATPHLLDPRWHVVLAWAVILCPVAGPGAVALASMTSETSDWQHGFLIEGAACATGLVALLSMGRRPEVPPRAPRASLAYLPPLVVASAAALYALHWGQLHGWLESPDIEVAFALAAGSLALALWLAWPYLEWALLAENWPRLVLFFFGGTCQFFYGYIMNTYGGTIVNLSSWQRAWLIWPLPIGMALGFALSRLYVRCGFSLLGLPGAVVGLVLLSAGFFMCQYVTMEWPYWDVRTIVELNWFQSPGTWELAPGRSLMGLGISLFMVAMDGLASRDAEREERVRSLLQVVQFFGGGIAAAVLINFLIIGHKVHYSYSAERDTIQADELVRHTELLRTELHDVGQPSPEHSARVLLYRFINNEASNLVFATIYALFGLTALALAGLIAAVWILRLMHGIARRAPPGRDGSAYSPVARSGNSPAEARPYAR